MRRSNLDRSPGLNMKSWELIYTAWKATITILVLRYLYFGRSNLAPHSQPRRSPTPSLATQPIPYPVFDRQEESSGYFHGTDEFDINDLVDGSSSTDPDYLTPGDYFNDPLSRSPSPLASPRHYTEPPSSDMWNTRYFAHDEAFATLFSALSALHDEVGITISRYVHMPMLVLALVTRPHSKERALCLTFLAKFKDSMATSAPSPRDPRDLAVEIQWEKLDEYSEAVERLRQDTGVERPMTQSAPEWNWWDMLKHIDMNISCKLYPTLRGARSIEPAVVEAPHRGALRRPKNGFLRYTKHGDLKFRLWCREGTREPVPV